MFVHKITDKIDEKFKEIVKFYAEDDKMTIDDLIVIFRQFYNDLKEQNRIIEILNLVT